MGFLKWLYTAYGLLVFSVVFFTLLPFLFIPILFPSQYNLIGIINRIWAKALFIGIGKPYRVELRAPLNKNRQYIFCPNHFSYIDIPTMGLNPVNTIFVGKSSMSKVPLFGYMYSRLHITVDRSNLKSRYSSMIQSLEAIDQGKSLVIFPEGGIMTKKDPVISRFKDGAFRTAIEKQIPIVPVTIPYNWIILPPYEFRVWRGRIKVIFHEPIETTGLTLNDVDTLKDKVFGIMNEELKKHLL
jgi:1-acyl-sn-glycerol-3-phosphate acyltransferase